MIKHLNLKRSENVPNFYHLTVGVVQHGYRFLALEIIHRPTPARCQPAAAGLPPPLPPAGLLESILDAVISADRCTRWEEVRGWELSTDDSICCGHGDVTLGSIFFCTWWVCTASLWGLCIVLDVSIPRAAAGNRCLEAGKKFYLLIIV